MPSPHAFSLIDALMPLAAAGVPRLWLRDDLWQLACREVLREGPRVPRLNEFACFTVMDMRVYPRSRRG